MKNNLRRELMISCLLLMIAVMLGAFGAHALKDSLSERAFTTYQTGITYHFYHGLALILVSLIGDYLKIRIQQVYWCFFMGIILFSGNCYLYALTQSKIFALIVPVGGVAFILGWFLLSLKLYKREQL
jgi:uncharacterized membrane protein YgdD (TMEM256/DUF423 family)